MKKNVYWHKNLLRNQGWEFRERDNGQPLGKVRSSYGGRPEKNWPLADFGGRWFFDGLWKQSGWE